MQKLLVLFSVCFCLLFPSEAEARRKHHKQSSVPAALQHSKAKQKQQNRAANKYKLARIKNLTALKKLFGASGLQSLVLVDASTPAYYLDKNIGRLDPKNKLWYHTTCPWVKDFLDTELVEGHRVTGKQFKIASLIRTQWYQAKLKKRENGAILGPKWWQQSSHSTCATVDISFYKLGGSGKRWLRARLIELQTEGKVIAVEEKNGGHFHVMVLPTYK